MSEDMHPKHITHRNQLRDGQPYLVGSVTSGDHPIQWEAYETWRRWVRDMDINEFDKEELDEFLEDIHMLNVYELSWAYSYRYKPEGLQ